MSKKYRGIIPEIQDAKEPTIITKIDIMKAFEAVAKLESKIKPSSLYITWGCIINGYVTRNISNLIYCDDKKCKNCRKFEKIFASTEEK